MSAFLDVQLSADLSDADFIERARFVVPRGGASALAAVFVLVERHQAVWDTDAGRELVVVMIEAMLDAIESDAVGPLLDALAVCPLRIAQSMYDTLLQAFGGALDDPAELADAILLCFALLTGASGRADDVGPLLARAGEGRSDAMFGTPAAIIAAHHAVAMPREEAFVPKLIIWDLDDTLWTGMLAEGDEPHLDARRAKFVRALNRHGVVSAICSKNDAAAARRALERFGLWEEFVFPRIAFVPKGEVIKQLIADMQAAGRQRRVRRRQST